jgi:hypothetical protein
MLVNVRKENRGIGEEIGSKLGTEDEGGEYTGVMEGWQCCGYG